MKKKNVKKILLALTALSFTFGLSFVGASCSGGESVTPIVVVLELNKSEMNLVLGNSEKLEATYQNGGNEMVTYTSSDENIVTVNRGGVVTAVNIGQATVQASYAGKTVSCVVNVGLGEFVPVLQMTSVENGEITISTADGVDLGATVSFNGKNYDDCTLTYALSDSSMGEIKDGKFIPAKTGDVTVSVSAAWRGATSETAPTLSASVTVHVIDSVQFFVNGDMVDSVTLYSMANWGGQTFKNSMPFEVKTIVNGVELQTTVSVVGGDGMIRLDGGVLTAQKAGVGELKLSAANEEKEFEILLPIEIIRPVAEYSDKITNFSFAEDTLAIEEIFGAGATLTDAYQDGEVLELDGNSILNLKASDTEKTVTSVTLYTEQAGYTLQVEGYTRIVDSAEEMLSLITGKDVTMTGYNFLTKDLVLPELASQWNRRTFENGVFDGNGHTLTVSVAENYFFGLFGDMYNATVKNVNIQMTKNFGGKLNPDTVLAYQTTGANFENVSFSLRRSADDDTASYENVLVLSYEPSSFKNVVVTLADGVIVGKTADAALGIWSDSIRSSSENAYIISPQEITVKYATYYQSLSELPETETFAGLENSGYFVYDKENTAIVWKPSVEKILAVQLNGETKTEIDVNANDSVTVTGAYLGGSLTPALTIVEGSEFITLDGNTIRALEKIGSAKVCATFIASGLTVEKIITVVVGYPTYQNGVILLSDTTEKAYLPEGLTIDKVTDTSGVVYYENGAWKWSEITAPSTAEIVKKTLYVHTGETVWSVSAEIYTGVIKTADDLKYLVSGAKSYSNKLPNATYGFSATTEETKKARSGYWILAADLEIDGVAWTSSEAFYNHRYFENGVFDGNGHTLKVTANGDWRFGLFGNLYNVVIKNLHLDFFGANGKFNKGQNYCTVLAYSMDNSYLKDCFIEIGGEVTSAVSELLLTSTWNTEGVFTNVVVQIANGILAENGKVEGVRNSYSANGEEIRTFNCIILAPVTVTTTSWELAYQSAEAFAAAEGSWKGSLADLTAGEYWTYDETTKTLTFGKKNA